MTLETENLIYVCTDRENAEVKLLLPHRLIAWMKQNNMEISELNLSNPDPESTDAAEYKLLEPEMAEFQFAV